MISVTDYDYLGIHVPIQPTNIIFRDYNQNTFRPLGKVTVSVRYKNKCEQLELYIVQQFRKAILGRRWIRRLRIDLLELDEQKRILMEENNVNSIEAEQLDNVLSAYSDVLSAYSEVFQEKIGCIPNYTVKLQLRPHVKPCYTKEHTVPYALRDKVEEKLAQLEKDDIIEKINDCDWGSPLVITPQSNDRIRLCADYKVGVNERLVTNIFPI